MPREPRPIHTVTPGYYRHRLVMRGPWVAAEIALIGDLVMISVDGGPAIPSIRVGELADTVVSEVAAGGAFRHPLLRVLWFGEAITGSEYRHMLRTSEWARRSAPDHPAANPHKPIDINIIPIGRLF